MDEKKIAILGLPGSGKTTFLSVLMYALSERSNKKIPWLIFPIPPVDETYLDLYTLESDIFTNNCFPPRTEETTKFAFICERQMQTLGLNPGGRLKLITIDYPGITIEGQPSDYDHVRRYYSNFDQDGILFFIDPEMRWLEQANISIEDSSTYYFSLFSRIFKELQGRLDRIPMVFCISKIDILAVGSEASYPTRSEEVEEIAERILGRGAKSLIDHAIHPDYLLWSSVSSIGLNSKRVVRKLYNGNVVDGIEKFKKDKHRIQDIQPIGVTETFVWLLEKILQKDEDQRRRARIRAERYSKTIQKALKK